MQWSSSLPTRCREPSRLLPTRPWSPGDGPHPTVRVEPRHDGLLGVVLNGRATSVPFTEVLDGPQRTTTDNTAARSTSVGPHPRRWQQRPNRLWEQGVNVADVAIELSQAAQVGAH